MKLLASAPTPEGITKLIARYWYDEPANVWLKPDDYIDGWQVWKNGKFYDAYRVTFHKGRYRFERIEP